MPVPHSMRPCLLHGVHYRTAYIDFHDLAGQSHLRRTQRGTMPQTTLLAVFENIAQTRIWPPLSALAEVLNLNCMSETIPLPKAWPSLQHPETTARRGTGVDSIRKSCTWNYYFNNSWWYITLKKKKSTLNARSRTVVLLSAETERSRSKE